LTVRASGRTDLDAFEVAALHVRIVRVRLPVPAVTALGTMRERAALLVRIAAPDGALGWGEVFANWPPGGALHRRRLLRELFAPALEGRAFESPEAMLDHLGRATRVLRLQCDEPGPFDQCAAGLAIAAWDLVATRAGVRLAERLRARLGGPGPAADSVPAYASGIPPARLAEVVATWRARGVSAFKTMVGARWREALPALAAVRERHGAAIELMVDANQAWSIDEAIAAVRALRGLGLRWIEEPLAVDAPDDDWRRVAEAADAPIAGGENLRGDEAFDAAIALGALRVLQPDVIKWGGPIRVAAIGRRALQAGLRFCPHYLGGPVGWRASAHVLAAVGGDGMLETDAGGALLADAIGLPQRLDPAGRVPLEPLAPPEGRRR
jgi:L-alanine-DL-glutamate epimerase-like enolase superfamily enzyme